MEIGSLAEWVAATVAIVAALYAYKAFQAARDQVDEAQAQSKHTADQLALELERENDRINNKRQHQAAQVSAWRVQRPKPGCTSTKPLYRYGVCLLNGSDSSVFEVSAPVQKLNGEVLYPLNVSVLPPGTYVIWEHEHFKWGNLTLHDTASSDTELPGRGKPLADWIAFTDSSGNYWKRCADGKLTEIDANEWETLQQQIVARRREV